MEKYIFFNFLLFPYDFRFEPTCNPGDKCVYSTFFTTLSFFTASRVTVYVSDTLAQLSLEMRLCRVPLLSNHIPLFFHFAILPFSDLGCLSFTHCSCFSWESGYSYSGNGTQCPQIIFCGFSFSDQVRWLWLSMFFNLLVAVVAVVDYLLQWHSSNQQDLGWIL